MSEYSRAYTELVIAMVRTGVVGYGGGPSILPLIRYEAVTRYKWLEDEEFAEIVALANTLPGPIATKIAAYLGYRLRGSLGALVAVLTHILPSCVAIVILLGVLSAFRASPVIRGMIDAVSPVIAVMLAGMAFDFFIKAKKGLGWTLAIVFSVIACVLLAWLHLSDAVVVLCFLAYGAMHLSLMHQITRRFEQRKEGGVSS